MSAIAKPLINSTKVVSGASDMVNVDLCVNITKAGDTKIVFHTPNTIGAPVFTEWKYATTILRDEDFASILALASNTLA